MVTWLHVNLLDRQANLRSLNLIALAIVIATDLNYVRLLMRIKLVKTDGSVIENAATNIVGCVSNFQHSMFSFLSVSLNVKPVTFHETNYHYKCYIEKGLIDGSDAASTHLVSSFWYLDFPGELKQSTSYAKKLNYHSNRKTLELYGRLHAVLFKYDKTLFNCVDMNIKLTRTTDSFYLLAPSDDNNSRITILDATLFITQVHLKPSLLLAYANVLGMKRKAHYPVTHSN